MELLSCELPPILAAAADGLLLNEHKTPSTSTKSRTVGRVRPHRDTHIEQQQTETVETEVRDVDGIRITKVYACCPGPSGGS